MEYIGCGSGPGCRADHRTTGISIAMEVAPLESLDNVEMDTAYSPDALIECLGSLLEKCNPKVCQPQSTELCNCLKYYCHAQTTEKCASTMLSRNEPSSSFGGTVEMIYFLWN